MPHAASGRRLYLGMYAVTNASRAAWQLFFDALAPHWEDAFSEQLELGFDTGEEAHFDANLALVQSCGYPFVMSLSRNHCAVLTAIFDWPGCEPGGQYRSWFIARAEDTRQSLAEFLGARVAINSPDSNSGMNVLRYAVYELMSEWADKGKGALAAGEGYFSASTVTGSHVASLQAVLDGESDLAAVDVVSYALFAAAFPDRAARCRCVGQSAATMGLPILCAGDHPLAKKKSHRQQVLQMFDLACQSMPGEARRTLGLKGFRLVNKRDYLPIAQMHQDSRNVKWLRP